MSSDDWNKDFGDLVKDVRAIASSSELSARSLVPVGWVGMVPVECWLSRTVQKLASFLLHGIRSRV